MKVDDNTFTYDEPPSMGMDRKYASPLSMLKTPIINTSALAPREDDGSPASPRKSPLAKISPP